MPTTWITTDGSTITRPATMSDSEWGDVLYGAGWTPGASPGAAGAGSGAGSPGTATQAQTAGLIAIMMEAGGNLFSSIFGAITAVDQANQTVTTATGQTVPVASLGNVSASGLPPGWGLNVDVKGEGFLDSPLNIALLMGGAGLVLLLVMSR